MRNHLHDLRCSATFVPPTEQLAGKIGIVARIVGVSPSTIRRRLKDDPDFPKPFQLSNEGDLLWPLAEVRAYLERKAGRPLAA
jgi:predicted DNA-binding transcriptional regulator AlpA